MFSTSTNAAVDADSTTSRLIITNDPTTSDIDQQSNSQIYDYFTISAVNTHSMVNASPQCHCTTPKYIFFLATIPGFVLITPFAVMVIKVLSKKVHKTRRRSGTRMRTSRRPIVRDLGSLQISCVVNEGNVEGIDMR